MLAPIVLSFMRVCRNVKQGDVLVFYYPYPYSYANFSIYLLKYFG